MDAPCIYGHLTILIGVEYNEGEWTFDRLAPEHYPVTFAFKLWGLCLKLGSDPGVNVLVECVVSRAFPKLSERIEKPVS